MDKNFEERMKRMATSAIETNADKDETKPVKVEDHKEPAEKQDDSPSVQKRINKLVAEKKSAKEEHEKLRAEFEDYKKKSSVKTEEPPMKGEPKIKDYDHVDKWAADMKKFHMQETTKSVENKLRIESKDKEIKTKYSKMLETGKKMTDTHGLEPDEYEDRIKGMEGHLKMHYAAHNELLDSDYSHLIALDIADDPESFSKLSEGDTGGAKQIKWIAKREAYHENNAKVKDPSEDKSPRKTTKAAAPDTKLSTGLGMNDDKALSKKDGSINWDNMRKAVKRNR